MCMKWCAQLRERSLWFQFVRLERVPFLTFLMKSCFQLDQSSTRSYVSCLWETSEMLTPRSALPLTSALINSFVATLKTKHIVPTVRSKGKSRNLKVLGWKSKQNAEKNLNCCALQTAYNSSKFFLLALLADYLYLHFKICSAVFVSIVIASDWKPTLVFCLNKLVRENDSFSSRKSGKSQGNWILQSSRNHVNSICFLCVSCFSRFCSECSDVIDLIRSNVDRFFLNDWLLEGWMYKWIEWLTVGRLACHLRVDFWPRAPTCR